MQTCQLSERGFLFDCSNILIISVIYRTSRATTNEIYDN